MGQCIWIGCKDQAWESELSERSYFCLEHAYRNMRGDLVMNEAQLAIYNKEGFLDALRAQWRFPDWYLKQREQRSNRTEPWGGMANQCWDCGRVIVAAPHRGPEGTMVKIKYCGRCRSKRGLPDDEREPMLQCDNYGKDRILNRECIRWIPIMSTFRPKGSNMTLCGPCFIKLNAVTAECRQGYGYDF